MSAAGLNGRAPGIDRLRRRPWPTRITRWRAARAPGSSIEEVHTPATAPGLGANPAYLHTAASGGIDSRPSPGYARRGGLYQVTYHNYADRDSTYSFDRADVEVVQHLPVLRENLGPLPARAPADDARRRRHGAVLSAAVARQRQHAAGLRQLALPRPPQPADVGRVALDSEPDGARHGDLLRHRQGGESVGRPEFEGYWRTTSAWGSGSIVRWRRRCGSSWRAGAKASSWSSPGVRHFDPHLSSRLDVASRIRRQARVAPPGSCWRCSC